MEQIEVISWTILNALRQAITHTYDVIGNIDTDEQMSVFCSIDEDHLELSYNELDSSFIRRFDDEDEMLEKIKERKSELGEDEYDSMEYYDDDEYEKDDGGENYEGYKIADEDDEDEF